MRFRNIQTCLLLGFPNHSLRNALAQLYQTAWNCPLPLAWLVAPFLQQDLARVNDDCADAYYWLVRVQPLQRILPLWLLCYSYLKASTGLSFDARHAGYNAKVTLTPMPNPNAPRNTVGVKTGVLPRPPPAAGPPPIPPPNSPLLKSKATTFANPQPRMIPMVAPITPIITDSPRKIPSTVRLP